MECSIAPEHFSAYEVGFEGNIPVEPPSAASLFSKVYDFEVYTDLDELQDIDEPTRYQQSQSEAESESTTDTEPEDYEAGSSVVETSADTSREEGQGQSETSENVPQPSEHTTDEGSTVDVIEEPEEISSESDMT